MKGFLKKCKFHNLLELVNYIHCPTYNVQYYKNVETQGAVHFHRSEGYNLGKFK